MEYAGGTVARSLKGHDFDRLFVIVKTSESFVWLIDGKRRKKHNPKKKNFKHIEITATYIPEFDSLSDKALRKKLNRLKKQYLRR